MEIRKVFRSGGSLCVALPPEYVRAMGMELGSYVSLVMTAEWKLVLSKVDPMSERRVVGGSKETTV